MGCFRIYNIASRSVVSTEIRKIRQLENFVVAELAIQMNHIGDTVV